MCAFVAATALTIGAAPDAHAVIIKLGEHHDLDTNSSQELYYDTETMHFTLFYTYHDSGRSGVHVLTPFGTPGEHGGSGLAPDSDEILEDLKQLASTAVEQEDPWKVLLVMVLIDDMIGPGVTDPWDFGAFAANDYEGFGSGNGFDPNVPFDEQLNRNGKEDDDDEDETSLSSQVDPSVYGEYYGLSPEWINPVPVWK